MDIQPYSLLDLATDVMFVVQNIYTKLIGGGTRHIYKTHYTEKANDDAFFKTYNLRMVLMRIKNSFRHEPSKKLVFSLMYIVCVCPYLVHLPDHATPGKIGSLASYMYKYNRVGMP